jgi:hypothetical protein
VFARRPLSAALLAALALASGCERPRPWPARIVLSLHGAASRPVHGIDVTIALPQGTSLAHDAATRRISRALLAPRQGALSATVDGTFVPHATTPFVRVLLASREPMRDGEVLALDAVVLSAVSPPRARFEVVKAAISGPGGAAVAGATAWVSAVDVPSRAPAPPP